MRKTLLTFLISISIISCKQNKRNTKIEDIPTEPIDIKASIIIPMSVNEIGKIKNVNLGCGYNYAFEENNLEISLPNTREVDIINKILSYSGIPSNFEIYKEN